ncbi:trehalose-6-phosphate synthase [Candidatus Gottesmanbacteria bacterium]|nr:trehalose-6-phosphate synthase [Candidatus Gottesmanbacteria bacterium]
MKQIIGAIVIIVFIISLIVFAFTYSQVEQEEKRLTSDLQFRSSLVAESLRETIEPNFINKSEEYLQTVVEKFADKERVVGLAIFDNKENVIAMTKTLPRQTFVNQEIAAHSMDQDQANGEFVKIDKKKIYLFALPLHDKESVVGSLMIVQNADYIDTRLIDIWKNNMIRLFIQALLLSIATLLIIRWIIYQPIASLVESIRSMRMGIPQEEKGKSNYIFFGPLMREVANINRSLTEARHAASEEAKMRLEKLDTPWTKERLKEFVKEFLKDRTIFLVSNREPYIHVKEGGKIKYFFPASGMATAIEPIMQACGGTWIAHGSGNADKLVVDKHDRIKVPPEEPQYTLRRVWLTEEEEEGYYYGFANEGIWPLCHMAHTRPIFRKEDWQEYEKVNGKFAESILQEIKDIEKPLILIQDYHFALLPRMIKNQRPDAQVSIFWHIPWPTPEGFRICPWRKEMLNGMLGGDLIGFHTQLSCNNFLETVGREHESILDFEQFTITKGGHISLVKPFPISIPFSNGVYEIRGEKKEAKDPKKILEELHVHTKYIAVGVDRLDYTKGIIERLRAIEFFLDHNPQYRRQFALIQVAPPTRSRIERYLRFAEEVESEVNRINKKFTQNNWKPIVFLKKHHTHSEIFALYKAANVCLVTSLHDGMNLVAKEFVSVRDDEQGVLILSQFAGAARELKDALIVNPYNIEGTAEAIRLALTMSRVEQNRKMKRMREVVKNYNIYRWAADFLKTLSSIA